MQLTKNFNLKEFNCKDGTEVPEMYLANVKKLAKNLQVLRDYLGFPIMINSAYRTPSHNKKVGGASNSQHLEAKAGDLKVKQITPKQLYNAIAHLINTGRMDEGGLGLYDTFVHYDIRSNKARWNYSKKYK